MVLHNRPRETKASRQHETIFRGEVQPTRGRGSQEKKGKRRGRKQKETDLNEFKKMAGFRE